MKKIQIQIASVGQARLEERGANHTTLTRLAMTKTSSLFLWLEMYAKDKRRANTRASQLR